MGGCKLRYAESMKGKRTNPHAGFIPKEVYQVIFRHGPQFFLSCCHARCVDVFMEGKNARKEASHNRLFPDSSTMS